jgi:phospholipase/carboxylesterase
MRFTGSKLIGQLHKSKNEKESSLRFCMSLFGPEIPPLSGKKAKHVILFLHGLGADGNDLIELGSEMQPLFPDTHFVSPNAPFPCDMAPYGYQWFSLLDRSEENVIRGVEEAHPILDNYINSLLERFDIHEENLSIVGFSQGTMMALYTGLRRSKPLAGIVGFSGMLVDPKSVQTARRSSPPICLIHGDMDSVVPFAAMQAAEATLKVLPGLSLETHQRPGLGHGIDGMGLEAAVTFLSKQLRA